MRKAIAVAAAVLAGGGLTACGSRPAAPPPAPTPVVEPAPADECMLATGDGEPRDTLVVALGDLIDFGHAPVPRNDAERFVFRQLYETPKPVDCAGRGRAAAPAPYRLDSSATAGHGSMVLVPAADSSPLPVLLIRAVAGADGRDLLDRGADLLITRDPATLDYAAGRRDYIVAPLAWDRTYVLVAAVGSGLPAIGGDDAPSFRRMLARDAVRADARGAEPPFWWEHDSPCYALPSTTAASASGGRVVYARGDATARELAARIVALAAGAGKRLTAMPLEPAALAAALAATSEAGYVVALPRQPPASCDAVPPLPASARATLVPLIDTRAHVVVRRGAVRAAVEGDGGLRILPR